MAMTRVLFALAILATVSPSLAARMLKNIPYAVDCTGAPLDNCDFYFEGYKDGIPEFELKNRLGDYVVDPAVLRYAVSGYDAVAEVDNTGWGVVATGPVVLNQFYLNGYPGSVLKARTFNHPRHFKDFLGRCILLPIHSALFKFNMTTVNLNPKDGNIIFAEDRRCVVFKTGSVGIGDVDSPPAPAGKDSGDNNPVWASKGSSPPKSAGGALPTRPPVGSPVGDTDGSPIPTFFAGTTGFQPGAAPAEAPTEDLQAPDPFFTAPAEGPEEKQDPLFPDGLAPAEGPVEDQGPLFAQGLAPAEGPGWEFGEIDDLAPAPGTFDAAFPPMVSGAN